MMLSCQLNSFDSLITKIPDLVTYPEVKWFDASIIVMLVDLSTPSRICLDHGISHRHTLISISKTGLDSLGFTQPMKCLR